jgi:hypothetical protein
MWLIPRVPVAKLLSKDEARRIAALKREPL